MYERNYVIHVAYVCVCVMELKFLHERIGVVALLPGESGTESKGKELAFTSKSSYKWNYSNSAKDAYARYKNRKCVHGTRPETIDALFINCMLR